MSFETGNAQEKNQLSRVGGQTIISRQIQSKEGLSLKDYKSNWFVLFAHHSGSNSIYTPGFACLQTMYSGLRALDVNLAGLSIDNISPHVTWLNNIGGSHNANRVFFGFWFK